MKIWGYEIDVRSALVGGGVITAMTAINTVIIYSYIHTRCDGVDPLVVNSGADHFSCDYLLGNFSNQCPSGFPPLSTLCLSGFRSGVQLVAQGVAQFNTSLLQGTVCNNHFGGNASLQGCYNALNDECWSGAWGGFGWATSAQLAGNLVTNYCHKTASYAAGVAAGLTLFTSAVGAGASTLFSHCRNRAGKPTHKYGNELQTELLEDRGDETPTYRHKLMS